MKVVERVLKVKIHKETTAKMASGQSTQSSALTQIVPTIIFHPFSYFRTLAQLGHEPLPATLGHAFPWPLCVFAKNKVYQYPNAFKYLKHIREEDGFFGMFRGLTPRIICIVVNNVAVTRATVLIEENIVKKEEVQKDDSESVAWQKLGKKIAVESMAHTVGVVASHPFHVIMVRSMAQFIGKEHIYDNTLFSFGEIHSRDGILGFFYGLVPRLLGEVLTLSIANTLVFVVQRYLKPDKEDASTNAVAKAFCNLVASSITYPLFLVSTVMIVNGSADLVAGVEPLGRSVFPGWRECYKFLVKHGARARGNSMFFRKAISSTDIY